jgi:hypothetical protein
MTANVVQAAQTRNPSTAGGDITASWIVPPSEGHRLLAVLLVRNGNGAHTGDAAGWTQTVHEVGMLGVGGSGGVVSVYERTAEASEPGSVTFTGVTIGATHLDVFLIETDAPAWFSSSVVSGSSDVQTPAAGVSVTPTSGRGALVITGLIYSTTLGGPPLNLSGASVDFTGPVLSESGPHEWLAHLWIPRASGPVSVNPGFVLPGVKWASATVVLGEPRPVGLWLDWSGEGFGATDYDDCTDDLAGLTIARGASPEITGGAQPGSMTVKLNQRADGRYSPLTPGGPLEGLLADGVRVWHGVNADGLLHGVDPRGLFGGRIGSISPLLTAGASQTPQVEIVCEDAIGWLGRTDVQVPSARERTQRDFRAAVLAAAGESRTSLPREPFSLALSSWDGSALDALESLNGATGTRHSARPEDDRDDWYAYTARNRLWRLDGTADAAVDDATGDSPGITDSSGWRLSGDTVINRQRASVTPVSFTPWGVTVWECDALPVSMDAETRVWMLDFDDYVDAPSVSAAFTGSAPSIILEPFGASARLTVFTAGPTVLTALSIQGSIAQRGVTEGFVADDAASQALRGVRSGGDVGGDLVGPPASARGLAAHMVWRYGSPQFRPTLTVEAWMPQQFEVDLYDTISVTIAQLPLADRLFEVVGITHELIAAPVWRTTYVLEECRAQADPGWFTVGSSLLGGTDKLAY